MKLFFTFLVLFAGIGISISQNLNIGRHSTIDRPYSLVSLNSKCYYLEEKLYQTTPDSTNIVGLNANGAILFKHTIAFMTVNLARKLLITRDKCLFTAGPYHECDILDYRRNFLVKLDTNGTVKFQISYQYSTQSSPQEKFIDFVEHSDSSFYIVSDISLYHFSKSGQFISRDSIGFSSTSSICLLNNGNLLLNGMMNNTLQNIEITVAGTIVNQQTATNAVKSFIQTNSGNLIGITTTGSIEKLNSSLQLLASTNTAAITPSLYISAFELKNDSLLFTGNVTTSNTPVYGILDSSFNLLYLAQAPFQNVYPTGIAINKNNRVNIIARSTSSLSPRISFVSWYQFPLNGNFSGNQDIGVESFTMISTAHLQHYLYGVNFDVKIKNFTKDTIKSFYLNSSGFFSPMCGYYFLHKKCNTILPYSSILVQTGSFYYDLQHQPSGMSGYGEVCFFTTIPNNKTDINITNDVACAYMSITGLESLNEEKNEFTCFPQPFQNLFTITSNLDMFGLRLYNVIGAMVKEKSINGKTISFDASDLPNGIYFLRIETDKGSQTKKVIKN